MPQLFDKYAALDHVLGLLTSEKVIQRGYTTNPSTNMKQSKSFVMVDHLSESLSVLYYYSGRNRLENL